MVVPLIKTGRDWFRKRVKNKHMEIKKEAGIQMNAPERCENSRLYLRRKVRQKIMSEDKPHKGKSSSGFIECNSGIRTSSFRERIL